MNDIKQFIIVRNDLNMKKSELASHVAAASFKFLIENNEAARGDQVFVTLSNNEASWLTGSLQQVILEANSEAQLHDIMTRAEILGIEAHTSEKDDRLACVALGPDDTEVLQRIVHRLKPM
jgi:peptidyl-tRNA hydrolase